MRCSSMLLGQHMAPVTPHASVVLPKLPCIWDETEILLKASVEGRDQSLASLWVRAYKRNMICFPRLHVVSDNITLVAARFSSIPNVTFHQLHWPSLLLDAGLGHSIYSSQGSKKLHGLPVVYFAIQWPMMWADNFTVAKHVMILDTDTLPVLPLRCHHFFDTDERPVWHTWEWPKSPAWLRHVNDVFNITGGGAHGALSARADFMTFFPVIIPRDVLKPAREAVARAYGCRFDEAWLRMKNPSYGDILGKAAALLRPRSVKVVNCPAVGRINTMIPPEIFAQQNANACRDHVTVVEHVKHPFRDCHTGQCHHLSRKDAVQYGARLLERASAFTKSGTGFPGELFHYQATRTLEDQMALEKRTLQSDPPGRVCGVLPRSKESSDSGGALTLTELSEGQKEDRISILVYDNRFNSSAGVSQRHLLYRSATKLGVPLVVGSLVPASVRKWQPGDRELWLLRTLPRMSTKLVMLLDGFDTVLFCQARELYDKWQRLAGGNRVLISGEKQLWPEEGTYHGERWRGPDGVYPKAALAEPTESNGGTTKADVNSHRYINIGGLIGPPKSLMALFNCMYDRYTSFPYQCPIHVLKDGSYQYVSAAPFHTRRVGTVKGAWGWEQACFHTYIVEQAKGALPEACPHLVVDHRSDFMLNFNKIGPDLVWPWRDEQRMRSPFSEASSCVLHANGAGKYAMPVLHYWWDHVHSPQRAAFRGELQMLSTSRRAGSRAVGKMNPDEDAHARLIRNFSRGYVDQWVNALKPQSLRMSSAVIMLKNALRTLDI